MNSGALIGEVAARYLDVRMHPDEPGIARFSLDRMTPPQIGSICRAVLDHGRLAGQAEMHIPAALVDGEEVPEVALTRDSIVHWRHRELEDPRKSVLLLANSGDDKTQSLDTVRKIGAQELKAEAELWVAGAGLEERLDREQQKFAAKALLGLHETGGASLDVFADYVAAVAEAVLQEGLAIEDALDHALPALRLPRNSGEFVTIPRAKRGHKNQWAARYNRLFDKVGCYLRKETPQRELIERDDLRRALGELENDRGIDPETVEIVRAFIEAPYADWTEEAAHLAKLEWSQVEPIFRGIRRKGVPLAERTRLFFEREHPNELEPQEEDYLEDLKDKTRKQADDLDVEFYQAHAAQLVEAPKLKADWDRFVYGAPREYGDFLVGLLLSVQHLIVRSGDEATGRILRVRTDRPESMSTWERRNHDAVVFFAQRYKGIEEICRAAMGERVCFQLGRLFGGCLDRTKYQGSEHVNRAALQIKFTVELVDAPDSDAREAPAVQFIWTFGKDDSGSHKDAFGSQLRKDLDVLLATPHGEASMPLVEVSREAVSPKGRMQRLTLTDRTTVQDVERADNGRLAPLYDGSHQLRTHFEEELEALVAQGAVRRDDAAEIRRRFDAFAESYTRALQDWHRLESKGLASPAVLEQAEAYGRLLEGLRTHAPVDRARSRLWTIVLRVGIATVSNGARSAIIAPWNPLRLAELAVKARQTAQLLNELLDATTESFGDPRLFFQDRAHELGSVYYPEVCLRHSLETASGGPGLSERPQLLAVSESLNGYSLAERPVRDADLTPDEASDEAVKDTVASFGRVCDDYLGLLPHERANLCAVLYDNDARALPEAMFDAFAQRIDAAPDLRCDLYLYHGDGAHLRNVYEQQNQAADSDPHIVYSSEAARDFVSRLRIRFLDRRPAPSGEEGRFADLVLMQDVVSRRAGLAWHQVPEAPDEDLAAYVPPRPTRKRAMAPGDEAAVVYLAAPDQPAVGWAYLDALYGAVEGASNAGQHYRPARFVSLVSPKVRDLFERSHELGVWVVSVDDITDRNLLRSHGVEVIRYSRDRATGRNVVVSTKAAMRLLDTLIKRRLREVRPGDDVDLQPLATAFEKEATDLSGRIVMRAARHGVSAGELLGLVLSKRLAAEELGLEAQVAWHFLDDFADWFGDRAERLADILALSPQVANGEPVLKILITEAKYIGSANHIEAANKSAKQLRDTVARLGRALDSEVERLDRKLWLARLADLLVDGITPFAAETGPHGWSLEGWARAVRNDEVAIELLGHSHVLVSDDQTDVTPVQTRIKGAHYCSQEIYPLDEVRELVRAFAASQPLADERRAGGPSWSEAMRSKASPTDARAFEREPQPESERPEPALPATAAGASEARARPEDQREPDSAGETTLPGTVERDEEPRVPDADTLESVTLELLADGVCEVDRMRAELGRRYGLRVDDPGPDASSRPSELAIRHAAALLRLSKAGFIRKTEAGHYEITEQAVRAPPPGGGESADGGPAALRPGAEIERPERESARPDETSASASRIPSVEELKRPTLECLREGVHHSDAIRDHLAHAFGLTHGELNERLESGTSVFVNRHAWSLVRLRREGLIRKLGQREYELTETGRQWLEETSVGADAPPASAAERAPGDEAAREAAGKPPADEAPAPGSEGRAGPDWAPPALGRWIASLRAETELAGEQEGWLDEMESLLRRALTHFGMQAKVLGRRLTPNAALFRLKGSDKMSVDLVERHRKQLLTSYGLDVIAVQPAKGEVVVAVARPHREILSLAEIWGRRELARQEDGTNLSLVLGAREIDGELLYLNLADEFAGQARHAPHTLVAGTTGSGKSVLVQNLILDICATNPPGLARLHVIDPKMGLDYSWAEDLPHLQGGVVVEREPAIETLNWLVAEMDERYRLMRERRTASLSHYNRLVSESQRLPVRLLIHDEFAEWMMVEEYREAVQSTVGRLGVKARAAGIHLIFVAQRPDNQVFPMQLRSNLGNRLVLRVTDVGTSEIALGRRGAERLLGKGHLAARLEGERDEVILAQAPYLAPEQIDEVVRALKNEP